MNVNFRKDQPILFKLYRIGEWEPGSYVGESGSTYVVVSEKDSRLLFAHKVKDTVNEPSPGDVVTVKDNLEDNYSVEKYKYYGTLPNGINITAHLLGPKRLTDNAHITAWSFIKKAENDDE